MAGEWVQDIILGECPCTDETVSSESLVTPRCVCPRDHRGIVIHEKTCLMYKYETICEIKEPICTCPKDTVYHSNTCDCYSYVPETDDKKAAAAALEQWKLNRPGESMPPVLEANHPLMQKFQQTLKNFLEKENAIAMEQILNLKADLKQAKLDYDVDLEKIYISDCDTNAQRVLIEEYEAAVAKKMQERDEMEKKARASSEQYRQLQEKLAKEQLNERECTEELEALNNLCKQLEKWREETESDLTINQRMSDKMKQERRALTEEKRQMDMILYQLTDELWKLETRLELMTKQMQIKNSEMEQIRDRVMAYATELEDLDLDKRRLMSLWRSVVVNIKQRDNVYTSVRTDYNDLQENYYTLMKNLEITKKMIEDEILKSKELAMKKEKIASDKAAAEKLHEAEDLKRATLEEHIAEMVENMEMIEKDTDMIRAENKALNNSSSKLRREAERLADQKLQIEKQILINIQECLLNDKAVQHMANSINKMREMSAKLEIQLAEIENAHAKTQYDIQVYRYRQCLNNAKMEKAQAEVRAKEQELERLQEKYDQRVLTATKKQRELDIVLGRYAELKNKFGENSPQERRVHDLEMQIRAMREKTEKLQDEWLRHQGLVVKMTQQHQKIVTDINLIKKQNQICEQKAMQLQVEIDKLNAERRHVERSLRTLQGKLQLLERTRKEAIDRNNYTHCANLALTQEYTANLKDAEMEILVLEEEIENLEKEKVKLIKDLDKVQREALVWQRKGMQAVELKRNMKNAQSAAGEIGQMKNEIHKMEIRRTQLHRMAETLSEDLAKYVTRRDNAMDKARATAAVEAVHGSSAQMSQFNYHHKLRLAKSDVARAAKELKEAKEHLEFLKKEHARLEKESLETYECNRTLEERVATLLSECRETDRQKKYLLERVVRCQRLGNELTTAVNRNTLKVRKSKLTVLAEYEQATTLNDRLKYIVENLTREYPYLEDKFKTVMNTLTVVSPVTSPRDEEPTPDQQLDPCVFAVKAHTT